jgi:hypothetical protein
MWSRVKISWSEQKSVSNVYLWSVNSTIICKHWKNTYICMNILLCWAINDASKLENGANSEEVIHLVKIPRYVRFSTLIGRNLSLRFTGVRRPPRTGDAWIKLHMSVFGGWMELVAEVPRATLREGMRLSGTWVFCLGLEPLYMLGLCSCST